MAEGWGRPETSREIVAAAASPACPWCEGTGFETLQISDAPALELNDGNAAAVLALLGFDPCSGEATIAESRRAVMRARARGDVSEFVRPERRVYGAPRARENHVVDARPLVAVEFGMDEAGVRERVERFAAFVEKCAARGATVVRWA